MIRLFFSCNTIFDDSKQLVLAQIHGTCSIQQSIILCGKVDMAVNLLTELETVQGEEGRRADSGIYVHVEQSARDCVVRIARRD